MNKKIKILYTIPNFDTAGSGKVVYDLVKNLDKNKFEPEICVFHTKGIFFKEVEKLGVPIHVFQFTTPYKPLSSFLFRVWKISRFFKKHQFDLIHSWHWSSDFSETLAAKLAGIPFVYTKKNMGWGNKAWYIKSRLSKIIFTINSEMKNLFFKNYEKKVRYIPIGVDLDYFRNTKKSEHYNKTYFNIISVVNITPIKGIDLLINAVRVLVSKNYSIQLTIVGNIENDYARDLIQETEKEYYISFLGKKSDIRPFLLKSDLFVIPTLKKGEGQGIAPLEAMALNKIVLASNVTGLRDVLKGFENFLFKAEDIEDLVSKIEFIINMPLDKKRQTGQLMRNQVVTNFSLDNFISKTEKQYKFLVNF